MNKYRIEITPPREGTFHDVAVYEGYYAEEADAVFGALCTHRSSRKLLCAVGEVGHVVVKLLTVNLNRRTSGCKRVQ